MTEVEKYFFDKCIKKFTNRFLSVDLREEERKHKWYNHPDLNDMSKEAFEKGERYFYCEPANPYNPNGRQVKCEPKCVYECHVKLTAKEYEELVSKCE